MPFASSNRRGWWSATRLSQAAHGEQMPIATAVGMAGTPVPLSDGGISSVGALETARLNSAPQVVGSVRINQRRETDSSLPTERTPSTIVDQRFIDTGKTSSGTPTRFMDLQWQLGNTKIAGAVVSQYRGTFYKRARACVGGTTVDAANRMLRVEGPCMISAPNATACTGTSFPVTELTYYANTAALNDRGRLQKVSRFPSFTTTACGLELATTYSNYTAEGIPQSETDPNGVATTFVFSGTRMLGKSVGGATTNYAYDADGSLRSVQHPEGDYEVFCRHTSSVTSCDFTGPLLPRVAWKARSGVADGSSSAERINYEYWSDGSLKSETSVDASGSARLVKQYYPDLAGRLTWEGRGIATSGNGNVYTTRRYDGNGNIVAAGTTFTGAPDFCSLTTPSPLCSSMVFDRADRLAELDAHPTSTSTQKTCLDYDGQGNPRRIVPGCSSSDTCAVNQSAGALTVCTNSTSPATDYVIDDFGSVVAVRTPLDGG